MNLFTALFNKGFNRAQRKGTQPDYDGLLQAVNGLIAAKQINGTMVPYADNRDTYLRNGYNYNDIVYMVIKLIVDKACIPNWAPYDVVDEVALKEYTALRASVSGTNGVNLDAKTLVRMQNAQHKALKPAKDDRLTALFESPNPESSLNKHHALLWTSKLTFGGYTEEWFVPSGGLDGGYPTALEWQPYQLMDLFTNRAKPLRITGYQLRAWDLPFFTPDEILHEAYPNLDWSEDGRHFYGQSPLRAALRRTQRSNESQTAGVRAFQNGGIRGITYLDMPAELLKQDFNGTLTADQMNDLKKAYEARIAGGSDRAGSTTFSGYKVGFTPIGLSPVDLDQMSVEKWDMRMIAATFGAPSQLFNDPDNKTYANEAEGNKALILRCCLPLLNDRELAFNQKLRKLAPYKNGRRVVTYDIKQYSELEENKKDSAIWLAAADWMTKNEKRDQWGLPLRPEPEMDKIYVSNSIVPIDEVATPVQPDEQDDDTALDEAGANDFNQNEE